MKKYVTRSNVIGLILGLVAIVIFSIFKHPVLGILTGIIAVAAFWVPGGKVLDWIKALLATVAVGLAIYTFLHSEPMCSAIAKVFPAAFWIFNICGIAITAIIAGIWAWNGMEDYESEEKEKMQNWQPRMKVMDLTHYVKDEPQLVDVYHDKESGKVLIKYGNSYWFLERGKDKLIEETPDRCVIALRDGTRLITPYAQSLKAAL